MNETEVVLVNQSTGYLMIDIVNAYCERYEKVTLLAGGVNELERPLHKKVEWRKICAYDKRSLCSRMLSWVISFFQIVYLLRTQYKKAYVIYVTNPPISYWAAFFTKNEYSIIEYDIYPDALRNIGIGDRNIIFKFWIWANKRIFMRARHIFTLSQGMKKLIECYTDPYRIKVIYNWSMDNSMCPIAKEENPFVKEHCLESKFVVMYSGNIGYTHNVELIIKMAMRLQGYDDIVFMIIGDGGKKKELIKMAKDNSLRNCRFLDWQPSKKIKYSLNAADIAVVTLTDETALVSVPSKLYNILAVGKPLLCVAPENSEIARLITDECCGKSFNYNQLDYMVEYVLQLYKSPMIKACYETNALRISKNYTNDNAKEYVL